jgi:hypothetical protein
LRPGSLRPGDPGAPGPLPFLDRPARHRSTAAVDGHVARRGAHVNAHQNVLLHPLPPGVPLTPDPPTLHRRRPALWMQALGPQILHGMGEEGGGSI